MEVFNIYTSGATKHISKEVSYEWRKNTKKCLEQQGISNYKVKVFIPNDYFCYITKEPKTEKQCQDYFLYKVCKSDLLLVNIDNTENSVGTGMEVQTAKMLGIPVIGFGSKKYYQWIKDSCEVVFETLGETIDYIVDYYLN